jgi:UDP-glucuronate decarboxylase
LQRQPVIDLAQQELGWKPSVALEQGLEPTIAYFKKLLK